MNQPAASIAIFSAGTHVDHKTGKAFSFSESDLQAIADSYDPQVAEAPFVIGHPELDAPAYGWVKTLKVDGGVLYAEPHQVDPEFAEIVNAGRYKNRSASVYLPTTPGNPLPGKHYLKHVGWLGATPPSVKGLPTRTVQFAADDQALEFAQPLSFLGTTLVDLFQRLRDYFVERDGAEAAERIIPQWSIRTVDQATTAPTDVHSAPAYADPGNHLEISMTDQNTAALADIAARETAIKARETAVATQESKARRTDAVAFAEQLVNDGKLLPRQQASAVELILALPAETALSFAEGDTQVSKPAGDVLRTLLTDLPKRIDFAEKSPAERTAAAVEFAAPAGLVVDTGRAELHARAKAYQRTHPNTSFVEAVQAVGG